MWRGARRRLVGWVEKSTGCACGWGGGGGGHLQHQLHGHQEDHSAEGGEDEWEDQGKDYEADLKKVCSQIGHCRRVLNFRQEGDKGVCFEWEEAGVIGSENVGKDKRPAKEPPSAFALCYATEPPFTSAPPTFWKEEEGGGTGSCWTCLRRHEVTRGAAELKIEGLQRSAEYDEDQRGEQKDFKGWGLGVGSSAEKKGE